MSKLYPLSLYPNYCSDWTVEDAIRELLQNALDSSNHFSFHSDCTCVYISNKDSQLFPRDLLLGVTGKAAEEGSVGGYGEGFKVALLILLREGIEVTIFNRELLWKPVWDNSELFGTKVLAIEETPLGYDSGGLTFNIGGLSEKSIEIIKSRCLYIQDPKEYVLEDDKCRVFQEDVSRLFVGGLYISDTNLQYSYDFHPSQLKLNRDRRSVSGWDLNVATASLWASKGGAEEVATMLLEDSEDVSKLEYSWVGQAREDIKDACADLWKKEYKGKPLANNSGQFKLMKDEGYASVVTTGKSAFNEVTKSSQAYKEAEHTISYAQSCEDLIIEKLELCLDSVAFELYTDLSSLIQKIKDRGVNWND